MATLELIEAVRGSRLAAAWFQVNQRDADGMVANATGFAHASPAECQRETQPGIRAEATQLPGRGRMADEAC